MAQLKCSNDQTRTETSTDASTWRHDGINVCLQRGHFDMALQPLAQPLDCLEQRLLTSPGVHGILLLFGPVRDLRQEQSSCDKVSAFLCCEM